MIKLNNVSLMQMNQEIFKNISLSINKGDFIYLIGDTGSGKSSLLKTLYAEQKINSGEINIANINISKILDKQIPTLRKKLGIVFQDFQLLVDRNIYENLKFVLEATGWKNKEEINNRILEVLNKVYLNGYQNKMPYELSGGEQQRAVIARSLLNYPEIILADEPTGNLDPNKSEKIISLLKEINEHEKTTVIIATHDYEIIRKFPSRTIKCTNKNLEEIDPTTL
ncbi:MAG: phosphonate ABC transporter ATP-binding protein [Flavobacteriales bacterium]|nr:phosphonate ABC transporter ATP-binding protein [Flavobacteriales bacterium]|tara:strand:+ start:3727 stop:4401 length:675 start_codon:yes stop_codon:yes gene_type:complete